MASTYSDLKFELIGTGEQSGTWGVTTNTNLGTAIEEAITGSADVTFASAQVTLTLTDTNASQTARNLRLNLTGTSGGAQNLIVPAIEKFYLVNNGCADAITVKNSTGTGIAVPAGKAMLVFNDGTNVVDAVTHMSSLTLTTALAVAQGGTGATDASTARTNLGVAIGSDVQAYDAGLADIAGLAVTDGNIIVGDGTNWVAESGATARTSLGLGTIATQASDNVAITGGSVTGITDITVADGGTGASSLTANAVLIGAGTSPITTVSPGTSGNVLTSDGTNWTSSAPAGGGGFSNMTAFTSSGQFNSTNIDSVKVTVVGGGGGGGDFTRFSDGESGWVSNGSGFAGGGGGTAIEYIDLTGVNSVAVTVGAAGNSAGTGGTSSFGAYCSATGGTAGATNGTAGTGLAGGGTGQGGTVNLVGGDGGGSDDFTGGFSGGSSHLGGGGATGTAPRSGTWASPTSAGNDYGGGGGGVVGSNHNLNVNYQGQGSAGGPGIVIIEY